MVLGFQHSPGAAFGESRQILACSGIARGVAPLSMPPSWRHGNTWHATAQGGRRAAGLRRGHDRLPASPRAGAGFQQGFWVPAQGLRDLCTEDGALLCFDEVMTGFRIAKGCAQAHFGIMPDLTTVRYWGLTSH